MTNKSKNSFNHNCADCKLTKKIVCDIDGEDVTSYESIMTGIGTADAAINPSLIEEDVSEEKMRTFVDMVLERKENYKKKEVEWWRSMLKKYEISSATKIDVFNGQFYVCLDKDGIERVDFEEKQNINGKDNNILKMP
jgi:hypothetical protein